MLGKAHQIILTVAAGALLLLTAMDVGLYVANGAVQKEFNANSQYLQGTVQIQSLYHEMVKAIGDLSVSKSDPQLRGLLSSRGMSVEAAPPAPAAAAGPKKVR